MPFETDVYLLDDEKYICRRCANFVITLSLYRNRYGYIDYEANCRCRYVSDGGKFLHCEFHGESYRPALLKYLENDQEEVYD